MAKEFKSLGKAGDTWGKTHLAEIYQDHYDKSEAEWDRKREIHDHEAKIAKTMADAEAFTKSLAAVAAHSTSLPANTSNASSVKKFKMPSVAALKKAAMAAAKRHMTAIAAKGLSSRQVTERVEARIDGTTIEFSTDPRRFAGSHQSPSIIIVGTLGQIKAKVNALPLRGQSFRRTYMATNGRGIGAIRHVELRHDSKVRHRLYDGLVIHG